MTTVGDSARYRMLSDASASPPDVLIVGAHAEEVRMWSTWLQSDDARVTVARDVPEARAQLEKSGVDVVVASLDAAWAIGPHGVASLAALAADAALVVFSRDANDVAGMAAIGQGAQDYLVLTDLESVSASRSLRYAVERKRLEGRLERLAHDDDLTGVTRGAVLHERTRLAIARASRKRGHCAIVAVRLEDLTSHEPDLGPEAADAIRKQVARSLTRCVRDYDTVARLGPDTFGVLVEDLDDWCGLDRVAERMLDCVGDVAVPVTSDPLRVSVGVARFPGVAQTAEGLVMVAQDALDGDRQQGGGQVVVAERELAASRA